MGKRIELTGQRFGRLLVLGPAPVPARHGSTQWRCRCDCGNAVIADSAQLRKGDTRSCGCLRREAAAARMRRSNALMSPAAAQPPADAVAGHNLKAATQVSRRNQSGVIGVSWHAANQTWLARLYFDGHYVLNRSFKRFEDAVAARRAAEAQYLTPVMKVKPPTDA